MLDFTDDELTALADALTTRFSCFPGTPAGDALAKIVAEEDARREFNRGFNDA
jgi:hypothetical protein